MHTRSRLRVAQAAAAVLTVSVLAGCGESGSSGSSVDEVAAHDGKVCPMRLPRGEDPNDGFGTGEPAVSAPSLPAPESAWVCQYSPTGAGPRKNGDGTTFIWVRTGDVSAVQSDRLPALRRELAGLAPAEDDPICTADLGPRWVLVYTHGHDLTGVVVDDFGCQDVRLTDDPFETVPGDATQAGTVPGVLTAPPSLLGDLKTLHGR